MNDLVIDIVVRRNTDEGQGGYLYSVLLDDGEDVIELASGHEDTVGDIFDIVRNLTERTLG